MNEVVSQQVGQANVNGSKLKALRIPLAPLAEQGRVLAAIDKHLSDIDAGAAALRRALASLRLYRAAVLKTACEGKLVPTEAELARREGRHYELASVLLDRVLKERFARWEHEQVTKIESRGRPAEGGNWRQRYRQPIAPDFSSLAAIPEGWTWATIEQLATKVVDGVHKKPDYVPEGVPFVTVRNLTAGSGVDLSRLNYVTPADHKAFSMRANPERDDLLVSKDGTLGVVRRVCTDAEFSIFVSVALIKPVNKQLSAFLERALSSPQVQKQMVPKGSGLVHIHLEDLRADCVPLPPLAEQYRIVAEVDRLLSTADETEHVLRAQLARSARLRQAVLKRAFEGKLVPQDPSDEPAAALLARIRAEKDSAPKPSSRTRKR